MLKGKHALFLVLSALLLGVWFSVAQSPQKRKPENKEENYNRPTPTRPIKPEIPSINRYQTDKVFLERADSLYTLPNYYAIADQPDHQIVKGNVKFRQGGMILTCDSAYYYPELNSLDAFGNVKMEQGDTLFAFAHVLYYNGDTKLARLKNGPSRHKVLLENRTVTLTTDSLNYNLETEIGQYDCGGELRDDVNTLTSIFGEYNTNTKNAEFQTDVVLVNRENNFTMYTDTLFYNTDTHIARIDSWTKIEGENDTIQTTQGWYDTNSGEAHLTARSMILHTDSIGNVTTLVGDSIIYDKETHISRAYQFRDPKRLPRPMEITDTANNVTLIGGFGIYNDSTKYALATEYPLLIEYSRPDTLFLRADTIETYTEQKLVMPAPTLQMIAERDSLQRLDSIVGVYMDSIRPVLIPIIKTFSKMNIPLYPSIETDAMEAVDNMPLEVIEADEIIAVKEEEQEETASEETDNSENEELQTEVDENEIMPPVLRNKDLPKPWKDEWGRDSSYMEQQDFLVAKAFHRARFFRKDMQGVADSMVYHEFDSLLNLYRKPVVWSDNRQINGPIITVHVNDSTADYAHLPQGGIMGESIEEDFYNQLSARKITAYFNGEQMERLEAEGNVMTIFLPQENDSTYNKLIYAESSFMTIDMDGSEMDRLKMWPEVTGEVTPLFMVKPTQKQLPGFVWLEAIRPKRQWYGDHVVWDDELGEVPEELEQYFSTSDAAPVGRRTLTK